MFIWGHFSSWVVTRKELVKVLSQKMPKSKKSVHTEHYKIRRMSPLSCRSCRNHGVTVHFQGHKQECVYKDCTCNLCMVAANLRRHTAARIAIYRENQRLLESDGMLYNNLRFLVQCWFNTIFDFLNNSYTICDARLVKG